MPVRCCASCTPPSPAGSASRRSHRHPVDAHHRELGSRDPDRALSAAADRVMDWSGGTRLGDCLRRFNDEWGVRGMARGAIVVVLSDGWDRR